MYDVSIYYILILKHIAHNTHTHWKEDEEFF